MIRLAGVLCLLPGSAAAGIFDIFRKREPEPAPEPLLIFGFSPASVLLVLLTFVLIGLIVKYRPRFILEILRGLVGDFFAWVLAVVAMCVVMFSYIYVFTELEILAAVIATVIVIVVVLVAGLFGS